MICPHCNAGLLRRERPDRRCAKCTRTFALEPKESPYGLHDRRLRTLAEKLSAGRGLYSTVTQLMYAAARGRLPSLRSGYRTILGCWMAIVIVPTYILSIVGGAVLGNTRWWTVPLIGLLILVIGLGVIRASWPLLRRRAHVRLQVTDEAFRDDVLAPWTAVYGGLPNGVVCEQWVGVPEIAHPRMVLTCADPSVRACMAANRVPERYGMLLVESIDDVPPGLPVLMLHDASVAGFDSVRAARPVLGDRMRVVGLSPRSVMDDPSAINLREPVLPRSATEFLHGEPLSGEEIFWLQDGWWSPIAAMPPARLLAAVSAGAERIEDDSDPDRRFARQLGFLSWPTA